MTGDRYFRLEVRVFARAMEDPLPANDSKWVWQDFQYYEFVDGIGGAVLDLREAESFQKCIGQWRWDGPVENV